MLLHTILFRKLITHCCNKADTLNPPIILCFVSLERLPWTTKWKIKFWPHLMLIHNQFSAISTVSHDLRVQNALTTTLSGLSTSIVCRLAVKSRAYGCVNMNINSFPSFLSSFLPYLLLCHLFSPLEAKCVIEQIPHINVTCVYVRFPLKNNKWG